MGEMKITVNCGTMHHAVRDIDVDEYGTRSARENVAIVDVGKALYILQGVLEDSTFAMSGNRNNPAVNASIALHVLGYNPIEWFREFFDVNDADFYHHDVDAFLDHLYRVAGYIEDWGPDDDPTAAFDKLV